MARPADVSSISSVSAPEDSPDDLAFDLPADLLDLSFDLPPDEASSSGSTACDATVPSAAEPPQPKQRKKKSKHLPAMPVLRSSRGRDLKFTVRYKSEGFKDDDTPWTVIERKRLLAALKEHGSSDVSKLAEAVCTRSVAAVSHFLKERRRLKDRVVIQGPAGNRAAYSCRVLRRALNVIRRRYDRTKVLPQVVAVCERQPFPEPAEDSAGELPQFEDLYQFMRELMDNHVPAVLEDCEHWLLNRLLLKLGTMIETLDLDASKQALKKGLLWAATQPIDGYSRSTDQDSAETQSGPSEEIAQLNLNYPSIKQRKDGLRSSFNPLQMSPTAVHGPWASIQKFLARNAFRHRSAETDHPEEPSSSPTAAASTPSAPSARKKVETRPLEAFRAWKK